jgi:hypothetical protein
LYFFFFLLFFNFVLNYLKAWEKKEKKAKNKTEPPPEPTELGFPLAMWGCTHEVRLVLCVARAGLEPETTTVSAC